MALDCIFCRIAVGEIPADIVYQTDLITAFRDIDPKARTHVLVIPNRHIPSLNEAHEVGDEILAALLKASAEIARSEGIHESGYRVLTNTGPDAGQTVFHLHLHVMGGNKLSAGLG